jgi:hypothetical protein
MIGERVMRLEFLPHGSPDCPLLRLYRFTPAEARQLHDNIAALVAGIAESVSVHDLPFVEALAGTRLTCRATTRDQSLTRGIAPGEFNCGFTPETWDNIVGLVEPFTRGSSGVQWLARGQDDACLILSVDGQW